MVLNLQCCPPHRAQALQQPARRQAQKPCDALVMQPQWRAQQEPPILPGQTFEQGATQALRAARAAPGLPSRTRYMRVQGRAWLRKLSSPMQRPWWSSHIITCSPRRSLTRGLVRAGRVRLQEQGLCASGERARCATGVVRAGALRLKSPTAPAAVKRALFGGKRGAAPPPTMARMLHRKSISTMPIPALLNSLLNCSPAAQPPERLGRSRRAQHAAAMHGPSGAGRRTVSLKGSQLYTRKPELVPQAKHVTSWLKFTDSSSSDPALRESPLCPMARGRPAAGSRRRRAARWAAWERRASGVPA